MKFPARRCLTVISLVLLPLVALYVTRIFSGSRADLSLGLVAVENTAGFPQAKGPTVLNGIKGLCATFAVTNHEKDASIWFDTVAVEHRSKAGWQRIKVPPYAARAEQRAAGENPWMGISSDDMGWRFLPGQHVYFVVEWPRGVPTNASWRLQLHCGREPSSKAKKWDNTLGVRFFAKRSQGQSIYTQAVSQ